MKLLTRYILSSFGGKVVMRSEVEKVCKRFKANPTNIINHMISYGYFTRILRGLYYVKSLEEFKLGRTVDTYKIITLGMEKLGINWYFGLYTALRLNGLTHEYFGIIFILNDEIFRPREIEINGEKVKFVKLKDSLVKFGIAERNKLRFSDPEKTILDFIYLFRYRGVPDEKIASFIEDYSGNLNLKRVKRYLKFYPKSVSRAVKDAGII